MRSQSQAPASTRSVTLALLLVLVPLQARADDAQEGAQDAVHRALTALGNISTTIQQLQSEFARPVAATADYDLEKRLVDARVHYDLRHYDMASILLLDLVENPAFRKNSDYTEAVWLLGHALYLERNWLAARQYFTELVTARAPQANDAMRLLVETALDLGWNDELQGLVEKLERSWAGAEPGVKYAWGKALFRLGRDMDAAQRLAEVPPQSPFFAPARYYLGVVATGRQDYEAALAYFREALTAPQGEDDGAPGIREQAALAVGRLSSELGQVDAAVDAYQTIDRQSPYFEVALYEMAYAYMARDRADQALHTLDVLLLTVEDDQLAVDASVLRARIQLSMDGADDASESYSEVIGRFTPIGNELAEFARSDANLASYFEWLLRRRSDSYDSAPPLSKRSAAFVEGVETMRPVIELFDDMAQQKADVKESAEIAELLETALSSPSRVDIFPNLQAGWIRIMETENRLILLSKDMLDAESAVVLAHVGGADRTQLEGAVAARHALEQQFMSTVPRTVADYKERRARVNDRFDQLKKDAFLTEQSIQRVREQLEAMDKVLTDARYAAQVAPGSGEREKALVSTIEAEKDSMRALYDELAQLKRDIELENARIGVGDFVASSEGNIKNQILQAHKHEHALYGRVGGAVGGEDGQAVGELRRLRGRIFEHFGELGAVLDRIQKSADDRIVTFKRLVALEKSRLASYRAEAQGYEAVSRNVARDVGNVLFREAQEKVAAVVLEADLGLLDIAWAEKQSKSDRIAELNQEKSERLQQLKEALEAIVEDETMDAPKAAPPDGAGEADDADDDEAEDADDGGAEESNE